MMNSALYQHIEKRKKELGYSDYSIQSFRLKINVNEKLYYIPAYNEIFFSLSDFPFGTKIFSDTEIISIDSARTIPELTEFSGLIIIEFRFGMSSSYDFIRVILQ